MSGRRAVAALAFLVVAGAAWGFVRETTVTGQPTQGKCLWWGTRALTFKVNTTSAANPPGGRAACPDCEPCYDAAAAAALIVQAVPTWGGATRAGEASACTDLSPEYGGATTSTVLGNDGMNIVVVRNGWCSQTTVVPLGDACRGHVGACAAKYNCWEHDPGGTIGLTTTTFDTGNGQILDSDIELFGWDGTAAGTGFYLTCAASPSCGQSPKSTKERDCTAVDIASLSLHEAGHVVGLDHVDLATAVMNPIIQTGNVRRALDADDVSGVCTIYPKGAATLTCGGTSSGGGGGGGCASAQGTGALALLGAALALLRARRR